MKQELLTLQIQRRRDVIRLRQKVRQLARLLGFDPLLVAFLAARAFSMACQGLDRQRPITISFHLHDGAFRMEGPAEPAAELALPAKLSFSPEDITWILKEMDANASMGLFDEIQRQNQELLDLLREMPAERRPATSLDSMGETAA
jgi:hypothetical protein